jgi:predicted enzyme related to lactoylglutathione lyase
MPADEYGRSLPRFTVNLMVRDVTRALPFYRDVLQVTVRYADADFAALEWN